MKRFIALFLCLVMMMTVSGCKNSERKAAVTEDGKKIVRVLTEESFDRYMESVVNIFRDELKDIEVEVEFLPAMADEREAALTRVRTEIMAGEGPDLFVLTTGTQSMRVADNPTELFTEKDALLKDVEETVTMDIFLPLDEYLSGEYLKFDEHIEVIMASGRTEDGQEILPLTYEYWAYVFRKDMIDGSYSDFDTWEGLKNCTDESINNFIGLQSTEWGPSVFSNLIDYESANLNMSEDEFSLLVKEVRAFDDKHTRSYKNDSDIPANYLMLRDYEVNKFNADFEESFPICIPNADDGITASVTSYVAVNRNCVNKEETVKLAELFFCERAPRIEEKVGFLGMDTRKVPFPEIKGTDAEKFLIDNTKRINYVCYSKDFTGVIKKLIRDMTVVDESEWDELISTAYRKMQMMAAE